MNASPGGLGETVLRCLLEMSWQAALLVVLVLLIQWIFRKRLSARWHCALWLIVFARLALPVLPESVASLYNLVSPQTQPVPVVAAVTPPPQVPILLDPTILYQYDPVGRLVETRSETAVTHYQYDADGRLLNHKATPIRESAPAPSAPQQSESETQHGWGTKLLAVWITGMLILGGCILRGFLGLSRGLKSATPVKADDVVKLLDDCRAIMGVNRQVVLLETSLVRSPAVCGLFSPKILLPSGFLKDFHGENLRHIFLHELAHVRRGDLWINVLALCVQAIHWFNPLVWYATACWRTDRELACDELVLVRAGQSQRTPYGETMLRLLENLSQTRATPGLVGIVEDRRQMAQRLRRIAAFQPPSEWSPLAGVLLIGLALIGLTEAQTPPAPASVESKSPAKREAVQKTNEVSNLRIQVLDNEAGKPVAGATVRTGSTSATTDLEGYALVAKPAVSGGQFMYRVIIGRSGFVAREIAWSSLQGDKRTNVPDRYLVKLDKGRTIGGHVRDGSGKGIANASIEISGPRRLPPQSREYPLFSGSSVDVKTDATGHWVFEEAPQRFEDLSFVVTHPNHTRESFRIDLENEPTTGSIKLPMADLAATNALMTLKSGTAISGRVVDQAGKPVGGVAITINREWNQPASKLTNGADGRFLISNASKPRFVIPDLPAGHMALTLQATGYAAKTHFVPLNPAPQEMTIVLAPGGILRGVVLNAAGEAVTNAYFAMDEAAGFGMPPYRYSTRADAEGRVVWDSAPEEPVAAAITAPGYLPQRLTNWLANGIERRIVLSRASATTERSVLKGRVLDAVSKTPVDSFYLNWEAAGRVGTAAPSPVEFRSGRFQAPMYLSGPVKDIKATFSASGYQPQTLVLTPAQMEPEIEVLLLPGEDLAGQVLLPDGSPAAKASVVFGYGRENLFVGDRRFETRRGEAAIEADADGRFKRRQMADWRVIAAVHEQGIGLMSIDDFKKNPILRLERWGRVEGVLRKGKVPEAGHTVRLRPLVPGLVMGSNESEFDLSNRTFSTKSDDTGRFVFPHVPPGEFKLVRTVPAGPVVPIENPLDRAEVIAKSHAGNSSHDLVVTVKPGAATEIVVGGQGNTAQARVFLPQKASFQWDKMSLSARLESGPILGTPAPGSKAEDYLRSKEFRAAIRARRFYSFSVSPDGSISVSDIAPGNYRLKIEAEKKDYPTPGVITRGPRVLASFEKDVVIPEGPSIDLGEILLVPTGAN